MAEKRGVRSETKGASSRAPSAKKKSGVKPSAAKKKSPYRKRRNRNLAAVIVIVVVIIATIALTRGTGNTQTGTSITVTAPTLASLHEARSALEIDWTSSGNVGDLVRIEYSRGGGSLSTITTSTPNTGVFSWNIPDGTESSSSYYVKVTSLSNPSVSDSSDTFEIAPNSGAYAGTITVSQPGAAASYARGSACAIVWTCAGDVGSSVKVEWRHGGSSVLNLISPSLANAGQAIWTLPSSLVLADDYVVRVTSTADTSIYAESAQFRVVLDTGASLQVGQFAEYSLHVTIDNQSGTHTGSGTNRIEVKEVTPNNVTYNISTTTDIAQNELAGQHDQLASQTALFGGIDLANPGAGVTITFNKMELVETMYGAKSCANYTYSTDKGQVGLMWVYGNVLMEFEVTGLAPPSSGQGTMFITYTLTSTNLSQVTA
ncbi:MAG TPA: hypothetical protein VMB46_08725 [Methanomassiliicoccales archaeon]|nr:hypothetical protein [Methanomassiliicoccales archaeon]